MEAVLRELDARTEVERDAYVEIKSRMTTARFREDGRAWRIETSDPRISVKVRGEFVGPGYHWSGMKERLGRPDSTRDVPHGI